MKNKPVSLNLNVRGMPKSATLAINEYSAQLERNGQHIYRFGLGQSPFPVPDSVVKALQQNAHQKDYLQVQGLSDLRQAVAVFHQKTDGTDIRTENVMIGPGSKELMFLLQLTFYGEILIPSPCWVSYIPQAQILGRKIRLIATHAEENFCLSPKHLADHCAGENDPHRPRLLILNYPSNPTGHTYSADELAEIAEIANRYNILVLSDEIYGQLCHDGDHRSIAQFYPECTIVSSGLSKWCGAGGWRLGTFAFPPDLKWLKDTMVAVASETYTSVSAPIQFAAVKAFECDEDIQFYLHHSRKILKGLGIWIYKTLLDADLFLPRPAGAFYVFPDFSPHRSALQKKGIRTSSELCNILLHETGVAILPGESFGRDPQELTARLAYVNFSGSAVLTASVRNGENPISEDFLRLNCPDVINGVLRLTDWLKSL